MCPTPACDVQDEMRRRAVRETDDAEEDRQFLYRVYEITGKAR